MSDIEFSAESGGSGEFSPEIPRQNITSTPNPSATHSRRQLFQPILGDVTNSKDDPSVQILQEVKKTNDSLAKFSDRIDQLEDRLKNVEENISTPASSSTDGSTVRTKRKIPARVRHEVRDVYKALLDADESTGFDLKKRFTDVDNQSVLARLRTEIKALDATIPSTQVRDATRRFFQTKIEEESLKRKGKYDEKVQRQRRQNRIKRKLDIRKSTLLKSSSVPEEQKVVAMQILTKEFMSSEESSVQNESDGAERPVIVVKPLPWRGPKANRYLKRLDQKANAKKSKQSLQQTLPRVIGRNSRRLKPIGFDEAFWGFVGK